MFKPESVDGLLAEHAITFLEVFETAEFEVSLLEYCDERGDFHYTYWNELDGKIGRSLRFDTRNKTVPD
ncbi:hypothetical protein ACFQ88_06775 [Paenibacillus sp. NPDC056579]|uniref:hypothetical protein n=1 Tax=Paenibacillus sp. NPDC056579 TaxID=3345871 RepID=UPI0036BA009D